MIVCPNCGQNLKFNIPLQLLYCDSCNSSFDPYDFDEKSADGIERTDYETTVFTCPQCGGEIESTDTDITGFCSFCGASTIFYSRLQKELKPDFILPFTKTKEECKLSYAARAKRNPYIPREYRDPQYIEGFRGIYMPYWSYDIDQRGPMSFRGEMVHRKGDYIIHEHYDLSGRMDAFYHGITYDASSSFSDDISGELAPFDVKKKRPFTAGFLSGFYADTSDVAPEVYAGKAFEFANQRTAQQLLAVPAFKGYRFSVNLYPGVKTPKTQLPNLKGYKVQRTLFPVWFMSYRHGDRVAYAAVNGQTGKVAADFPISLKRFYAGAGILAVILFAVLNLFLTMQARTTSLLAAILAVVTLVLYLIENSSIRRRDEKTDDAGYLFAKTNGVQPQTQGKKRHASYLAVTASILAIVITGLTWLSNSFHDEYHYIADVIAAALIGLTLGFLIRDYNVLATRPLPQFEKRGGDDGT